jgi:predicted DNA-binding protein with PD1-like motif
MKPKRIALALVLFSASLPAAEVFAGSRIEDVIRIRMDRGDLLLETIMDTIRKQNIQDGAVLSAAGTLQVCTFHAVKSMAEKPEQKFTTKQGPLEILNINGIIAAGEPHLHMTLGDPSGAAIGGHLENGCKVLYRAEITIAKFAGTKVARLPNEAGVPVMQRVDGAATPRKK